MAVNIYFNRRIERADAQASNNLRAVGDFRGSDDESVAETLYVVGEFCQLVRTDSECPGRSFVDALFKDKAQGFFLKHFGVDTEVGYFGTLSERTEHCVRS